MNSNMNSDVPITINHSFHHMRRLLRSPQDIKISLSQQEVYSKDISARPNLSGCRGVKHAAAEWKLPATSLWMMQTTPK